MEVIVPYSVFVIIVIAGIAQILISNSVVKQTAGSKKYDATNAGHSARRIGYAFDYHRRRFDGIVVCWQCK